MGAFWAVGQERVELSKVLGTFAIFIWVMVYTSKI
jgi:hypothetical protein